MGITYCTAVRSFQKAQRMSHVREQDLVQTAIQIALGTNETLSKTLRGTRASFTSFKKALMDDEDIYLCKNAEAFQLLSYTHSRRLLDRRINDELLSIVRPLRELDIRQVCIVLGCMYVCMYVCRRALNAGRGISRSASSGGASESSRPR